MGFNSTLVQLKANVPFLWLGCQSGFNSTLVQLKGVTAQIHRVGLQSFNSTLVQLKVYIIPEQIRE